MGARPAWATCQMTSQARLHSEEALCPKNQQKKRTLSLHVRERHTETQRRKMKRGWKQSNNKHL